MADAKNCNALGNCKKIGFVQEKDLFLSNVLRNIFSL